MITKLRGEEYIMHRHEKNPIITNSDFPLETHAVFNCGQTMYNGKTVLLIAAFYKTPLKKSRAGIHVAMSDDGINFTINPEPLFTTNYDWHGNCPGEFDRWVIDPRVTKIDDTYYIIRPGQVGGSGPCGLLYKTKDFETAEFVDCVALPSNRVPCLFPEKVNGLYVRLDRPYNIHAKEEPECIPDDDPLRGSIWISYSPDLVYWGHHRPLLYPESVPYSNWKIGPTSPVKTKDGWLEIIHGVWKEDGDFCYSIGAILLDLEDPSKVLHVLQHWILTPTEDYEVYGRVENVVFPCGFIADEEKDEIKIYYGAADEHIGLATGKLSELLEALKNSPAPY